MTEDSRWQRYWRYVTRRFRGEVDDEVRFHLEMRTRELIESGVPPDRAAREAARRFGDAGRVRRSLERIEQRRGQRMARRFWLDEVGQDLRYGLRSLARQPGFALAAVLSLALGIATLTTVYGLVDTYLVRPLPVAEPDDLLVLARRLAGPPAATVDAIPYPAFEAVRAHRDLFAEVAGFSMPGVMIQAGDGSGELGMVIAATGSYFPLLGLRPQLGRLLDEGDMTRRDPVLVLTDGFWRRRFGADRNVVGRSVRLNGSTFAVVGVAPAGFSGTVAILAGSGFIPRSLLGTLYPAANGVDERFDFGGVGMDVIARPRPGTTLATIRAGLDVIARDLARQYPKDTRDFRLLAYPETRARPAVSIAERAPLIAAIFLGLGGLGLLVASANVANLLLVRATARRPELGVRQALGASRTRLIRQLLVESVVLALGALAIGSGLAWAAMEWLSRIEIATELRIRLTVTPDWRIMAFAALAAVGASLLAGIGPAVFATRGGLRSAVGTGLRASAAGNRHRSVLVTAQLAVSLVAVVTAGLFTRSVHEAGRMDLGFRPEQVVKAAIVPQMAGYPDGAGASLFERVMGRVRAIPGVTHVAWSSALPFQLTNVNMVDVYLDTPVPGQRGLDHLEALVNWASTEYFATMGVPVDAGRPFTERDDSLAPRVAIVNATAAKLFWPGRNAVGQQFRTASGGPMVEVIGVARDGRYLFVNEPPRPLIYLSAKQQDDGGRILLARTAGDPVGLVSEIRRAIEAVDPNLTPIDLGTMTAHLRGSITFVLLRLAVVLAGVIGLVTLVQAGLGLYGVIGYSVTQRSREIGIRLALGAAPGGLVGSIVAAAGRLIIVGLGIGLLGAMMAGRVLGGLLVGIGGFDPVSVGLAVVVLVGVGLIATVLPARRAARVDPVRALRADG